MVYIILSCDCLDKINTFLPFGYILIGIVRFLKPLQAVQETLKDAILRNNSVGNVDNDGACAVRVKPHFLMRNE